MVVTKIANALRTLTSLLVPELFRLILRWLRGDRIRIAEQDITVKQLPNSSVRVEILLTVEAGTSPKYIETRVKDKISKL